MRHMKKDTCATKICKGEKSEDIHLAILVDDTVCSILSYARSDRMSPPLKRDFGNLTREKGIL